MPLDPNLARETYLEAFTAALSADRLVDGADTRAVAAAVLAAEWAPSDRPCDLLLDALAVDATDGVTAGAPALMMARCRRSANDRCPKRPICAWLPLACQMTALPGGCRGLGRPDRAPARARPAGPGVFSLLPIALSDRLRVELFFGRIAVATSLAAEADAVAEATGTRLTMRQALMLANWRGRDADAVALIEASRQDVLNRGEGLRLVAYEWGATMRYNALGRYDDSLAAAERAAANPRAMGQSLWGLAELIEAAARCGKPERAAGALARVREIADASGSGVGTREPRARGRAGRRRCGRRGPVPRGDRAAVAGSTRRRARAWRGSHLVYGEWLRREHRRVDAREQLRVAHTMLAEMGAEALAERARRELQATGETVRKRTPETLDELTPQESQIAHLAADGRTNTEIGGQLFLSPRTVEWHLRKVFGKLAITSRRELRAALSDLGAVVPA